ncbi:MAG: hypothetical protein BWY80_01377 [Firmicutes bacterium ADurb.Bin456]|nr:MAG: hypothetical protein BWY80_01377 [Firmicutes bacterium ADurb.Bin456]
MIPRLEGPGNLLPGQHGTDGETAAQRLGQGQNVRLHPEVLVGQKASGPAQSGLNFIKNQQGSVLLAEHLHALQIVAGGDIDPAFPLNWFQQNRAGGRPN